MIGITKISATKILITNLTRMYQFQIFLVINTITEDMDNQEIDKFQKKTVDVRNSCKLGFRRKVNIK